MIYSKKQNLICRICNCDYNYFLNKKNVVGVGCGYKIKCGFNTYNMCIKVFVKKKISKLNLKYKDIIPQTFKGIVTDVIETGIFTGSSLRNKIRPVKGGYSISTRDTGIDGSIGCLVTNGVSRFLLSTNHLLSEENTLPIGTEILQPAFRFGGVPIVDSIGTLYRYVPLRPIEGESRPINYSDAAIGLLKNPNILSNEIAFLGKITCVKSPKLNGSVQKVGSATELTQGTVTSITTTLTATLPSGKNYLFKDVIFTTQMSQNGDSGAILVNNNKCAVGLLFANSENTSAFSRLDRVFDQLDISLVK